MVIKTSRIYYKGNGEHGRWCVHLSLKVNYETEEWKVGLQGQPFYCLPELHLSSSAYLSNTCFILIACIHLYNETNFPGVKDLNCICMYMVCVVMGGMEVCGGVCDGVEGCR